jgi:predicted O-linked N-acetylglucosamine transferase (SPINDLY family)
MERAVELQQAGRTVDAALIYRAVIAQDPKHFDATHLLGVIALQENRLDEARNLIAAALRIRPDDPPALNNLGTVHLRNKQPELARALFERSAKLQPNDSSAQINLGTALRQLGRSREALGPLRTAHAQAPGSALVCNLLGACLLDSGDARAAVQLFEAATLAEPDSPDGWSNLAIALNDAGDHERAQEVASRAVAMGAESAAALGALAAVQFEKKQIEASLQTYRKAVALPNPSVQTLCGFANALWLGGRGAEALKNLRRATEIDGNNAYAAWKLTVTECQSFYETISEIEASRQRFSQGLDDLQAWFGATTRPEAYAAVASTQPFYIAYQAYNNRELLSRYGRVCEQWMGSFSFDAPKRDVRADGRMRVGMVSAHIRNHSVWHAITKGWFKHLDQTLFDVSLFHLGSIHDEETAAARQAAAHFEDRPRDLHSWAQTIAGAGLDALIYPDIGMDALTTQLASLRLAPVQAASWGHPETTGLPTMDLYLSAAGFEPPDADNNYSERLVRLPNLGVHAEPLMPEVEPPDLRLMGLPADQPLLLCPGIPFKYSPADDVVWARIARGMMSASSRRGWSGLADRLRRRGHGRLVFFRSGIDTLDGLFIQRLRKAFDAEKVDFDATVSVIPHLKRARFFGLMQHATLMLDTIGFSGFNTALQAVEAGLPVLAREGNFMRGRLASGVMRRMDMPELVAGTNDEFIRTAVALASDPAQCKALRVKIENRRGILFHDLEPVRALEKTLADAIRQHRTDQQYEA